MAKEYRDKRDPARTNEPFSAEQAPSTRTTDPTGTWTGQFVIHQHAASRMHYDLRLPFQKQLLSFAVPHGISLDPKVKHLAVNTETHPREYVDFEDVIPEGNYGAGAMIVWDTGSVAYQETSAEDGLARGKIDFILSGFKCQGRFALIATGRRKAETGLAGTGKAAAEWLLIKKPDDFAKAGPALTETLPWSVLSGLTVEELFHRDEHAASLMQLAEALGGRTLPPKAGREVGREVFQTPMVCSLEGASARHPDWLYELKLDGVRILAEKQDGSVQLTYRSGKVTTRSYPEIARAVRALPLEHVVLDGEIVTFDDKGRPNFERLGPRIKSLNSGRTSPNFSDVPVVYLAFDVLEVGHQGARLNLRQVPLEARKNFLGRLLPGKGFVRALDHLIERGDALWNLVEQEELEGMVAKRRDSLYEHGPARSPNWVKLKREEDDDFVVIGWTPGKAGRGGLGALCLGSYTAGVLTYRGRVGSGMSAATLRSLLELLVERETDASTAIQVPTDDLAGVRFCRPELVVRVRCHGFSSGGHLRAPVFLGLRDDVLPISCTLPSSRTKSPGGDNVEEFIALSRKAAPPEEPGVTTERGNVPGSSASPSKGSFASARFVASSRDKIYFPSEGITKGALLDYYAAIAPVMLPHLRGRPVVLVRYPDGIEGKSFYQWRAPEGTPSWIRTLDLYDDDKRAERGTDKSAFLIDDVDALLYIINLGCIPIHVLASREFSPDHCDFLTIDFDLGPRKLGDAIVMAHDLRGLLTELGLTGFPKTSGQSGLHVLVPLGPRVPFEGAKLLTELLGRVLVGRHPNVATMERRIEKRGNKLYIDTGQTGRSRTIVAPYSVRAYPGATVSTPLSWDELHLALDPGMFNIFSVAERLREHPDPQRHLLDETPDLSATLSRLSAWTGSGSAKVE